MTTHTHTRARRARARVRSQQIDTSGIILLLMADRIAEIPLLDSP